MIPATGRRWPHTRHVNLLARPREARVRQDEAGGPDDGASPHDPTGEIRGDRRDPADRNRSLRSLTSLRSLVIVSSGRAPAVLGPEVV